MAQMDIYQRKSRLKLALLAVAAVIGVLTVLYTNYLTQKIAIEEKHKAQLWADAISSKARLVRYTNDLFTRLGGDERKKVNIWAQSERFIIQVEDNDLLTFFTEIITTNDDIPVILTDETGKIIEHKNFELPAPKGQLNVHDERLNSFNIYPPIRVKVGKSYNYIYYRDSKLFAELKKTLSDLITSFITEVVVNTSSAPVIMTDTVGGLVAFGNIDSAKIMTPDQTIQLTAMMRARHEPITADLGEGSKRLIYYDDSLVLKQLKVFPFIQLAIFGLFLVFSYFVFSSSRRAEQNMVWVGMAKETAHQLGTPISSLSAWVDYLRDNGTTSHSDVLDEMDHDVERLTLVADRFSKIGSVPQLKSEHVNTVVNRNIDYMKRRASGQVNFNYNCDEDSLQMKINNQLFDWVLENLYKNALDAMQGTGTISTHAFVDGQTVIIDIADTGCGIARAQQKTIFEPGFSTKRRGWGLGLSLTKRIVESYHNGKIYVKESEIGKGTTFRIELGRG
jgi:Histidine kinase-, DNA gyrase B-, and HSP90-like ATPase